MQLPMIGTMEIDHGRQRTSFFFRRGVGNVISINLLLFFSFQFMKMVIIRAIKMMTNVIAVHIREKSP